MNGGKNKNERIKRVTWGVARNVLKAGEWANSQRPDRGAGVVDLANIVIAALADKGCLDEEYGDSGSFEITLAQGLVMKLSGAKNITTPNPISWYATTIFNNVRELDAAGLLSPDDRKRARTIAFDRETAEAEARKAAEDERERERKAEQGRRERAERREAARRRLAEIEKQKADNNKGV